MRFLKVNVNPKKKKTGDCAVRAVVQACNIPYEQAAKELFDEWMRTGIDMTQTAVFKTVLERHGFQAFGKPKPMTGYIYCTKGGRKLFKVFDIEGWSLPKEPINGKVFAKFTLNEVEEVHYDALGECFYIERNNFRTQVSSKTQVSSISYLTYKELEDYYFKNEFKFGLYAWHISDLVIFDEPKELSEFGLKSAPQSWCYVEAEE